MTPEMEYKLLSCKGLSEFLTMFFGLGKLVLKKNDNGIRYSSVFVPFELSGAPQIVTFDGMEYGNYALTQKGYTNIELASVEKKIAGKQQGLELMITEFSKAERS